jgi:uncharacterized protein YbaR (Trm112 family)
MAQAFILCPTTKNYVYVGMNLEWLDLETLALKDEELTCPQCGEKHVWNKDDLTLRADGGG